MPNLHKESCALDVHYLRLRVHNITCVERITIRKQCLIAIVYKYILGINGFFKTKREHFLTKRVDFANTRNIRWLVVVALVVNSSVGMCVAIVLGRQCEIKNLQYTSLQIWSKICKFVFAKLTLLVKKCSYLVL